VGEVLHFSEDPAIPVFVPHVAATARQAAAYVWAVDFRRAPDYWFPRECPRVLAWVKDGTTTDVDRERIIGAGCGERVHAIEYGWLDAMRSTRLYAYRLPAAAFRSFEDSHAQVAEVPVEPLGPAEPVGDLLECHAAAGIQLRVLDRLWPFWDAVTASTVGFSGIRLHNARPRAEPRT
jgi:hypothetical protein